MVTLALNGPMNRYELHKASNFSYALVHKSIKELAKNGLLSNYGKRHIERRPGKKKTNNYKHETTLWGLSNLGLWTLILADKTILRKWTTIKKEHDELAPHSLDYFELMFKIGVINQEYGYSTWHNYPNRTMVVQALLFLPVVSEKQIEYIYDDFARTLKEYPRGIIRLMLYRLEKEHETLSKFLNRCNLLEKKLERAARAS